MTTTERPGVYSSYEVSSALHAASNGKIVGIIAKADSGTACETYIISSYAEAVAQFGETCNLTKLIQLLLRNGASLIHAVPVATGETAVDKDDYGAAFAVIAADEAVKLMVCDSRDATVHAALSESIASAGESCKYRVGIVEATGTVSELTEKAAALNDERIVMVAPVESVGSDALPGAAAAALAGVLAMATDPALPLNGAVLYGLDGLSASYNETDITTLIRGGITPLECSSGIISVIRGITTRTKTGDVADATWRELTTTLIVDDVIPDIRRALRTRFARTKNTPQTRSAIRTQVILELERKVAREIIDSYSDVVIQVSEEDPTVCEVSFSFAVAHGLNQIHLTVHITV
ncbi:MAG: phage tail sheath C-terminal domain-containing protein [Oscillospiraceae bacterium]|jgi:phage tail sheath gpL-like